MACYCNVMSGDVCSHCRRLMNKSHLSTVERAMLAKSSQVRLEAACGKRPEPVTEESVKAEMYDHRPVAVVPVYVPVRETRYVPVTRTVVRVVERPVYVQRTVTRYVERDSSSDGLVAAAAIGGILGMLLAD